MAEKLVSLDDNETCKQYVIPSNEEIISELTKELDCANIKSAAENDGNVNKCDGRKLDHEGNNVDSSEEEVTAGVFENKADNEENHVKVDDDFIDEEALKDLEITYSVEEKEVYNVLICILGNMLRIQSSHKSKLVICIPCYSPNQAVRINTYLGQSWILLHSCIIT